MIKTELTAEGKIRISKISKPKIKIITDKNSIAIFANEETTISVLNIDEIEKFYFYFANNYAELIETSKGNFTIKGKKAGSGDDIWFTGTNADPKLIPVIINEQPKIPIELSKSTILFDKDTNWTDTIRITNYAELQNVRIGREWASVTGIKTEISNSGVITLSTKKDYHYNWLLDNFQTDWCTITADNAISGKDITINSNSMGRIAIADNPSTLRFHNLQNLYYFEYRYQLGEPIPCSDLHINQSTNYFDTAYMSDGCYFMCPYNQISSSNESALNIYGSRNGITFSTIVLKFSIDYARGGTGGTKNYNLPSDVIDENNEKMEKNNDK